MQIDNSQILNSPLTAQVVNCIWAKIADGSLKAGDSLPAEREFARMLNISRASLRSGIAYLASKGVVKVRRGVRTFVSDGSEKIGKSNIESLSGLYSSRSWQVFEARRLLECHLASLAAERGKVEHFTQLAEEIANMYAAIDDPETFLMHDMRFHRFIAHASGSPILAALMETVTTTFCEERRMAAESAQNKRIVMKEHQAIYRAIRAGNPSEARASMERHLQSSLKEQAHGQLGRGKTLNERAVNRVRELEYSFITDFMTLEAAGEGHESLPMHR